jgi:AcrR family transcriptional regulator
MANPGSETKDALLVAALTCFAENGFNGTSLRAIADRAQRPLSLIAHHFGSKEGLYLEVFRMILATCFQRRAETLKSLAATPPRDKAEATRLFREQILQLYHDVAFDEHPDDPFAEAKIRLWSQELRAPRRELVPILETYLKPLSEFWTQCIRCLRPDLKDPEITLIGISLLAMVAGHGLLAGINRIVWGSHLPIQEESMAAELLADFGMKGLVGVNNGQAS